MVNMKQKHIRTISNFFDSLFKKRLLKLNSKINNFFKLVADNTNFKVKKIKVFVVKSQISNINKIKIFVFKSQISFINIIVIAFITLSFTYLFYLSIPTLYNKAWLQNKIENQLLEKFKINFSTSYDISYRILPSPHFLIKNSKMFRNNDEKMIELAEIKMLKIFINQSNFFNKNNIVIKKLLIDDANFSFYEEDLVFLKKRSHKKFANKNIFINNSKIFIKSAEDETITIIKVKRGLFFYDEIKKKNLLKLKGEIFNLPFVFNLNKEFFNEKKSLITMKIKKLKLKIFNESKIANDLLKGLFNFSIFNSKIKTKYNIDKNLIIFGSNDLQSQNSNLDYKGEISLEPFDLNANINLKEYNLSKLFDANSIIFVLIQSELLFNENVSANIIIKIDSNKNSEIFKSSIVNFNIINNKINFDNTKLINKKIGFLELKNSNLFMENNKLILNTDVEINIENTKKLFSFFLTPKNSRKKIKKMLINLDYNFLEKQLIINNLKIDGTESNDGMTDIIERFNNSVDYNLNKSRRIFNELFAAYSG